MFDAWDWCISRQSWSLHPHSKQVKSVIAIHRLTIIESWNYWQIDKSRAFFLICFVFYLTLSHFNLLFFLLSTILPFLISCILLVGMVSGLDYKQTVCHYKKRVVATCRVSFHFCVSRSTLHYHSEFAPLPPQYNFTIYYLFYFTRRNGV